MFVLSLTDFKKYMFILAGHNVILIKDNLIGYVDNICSPI